VAPSVHSSIVINRPIEEVFAVLTNVENTGKWFPGDVKEWWTSPPPHGIGSTRRARVRMGFITTENDAVATVFEPPHRAGLKGTSRNAPFEVMLTFERVDGATRVESDIDLFMRGPARMLGGVFTRSYGRSWDQGLRSLKRMMEAGEL
jgi:carbon monoxide dehydrogenase subunit G